MHNHNNIDMHHSSDNSIYGFLLTFCAYIIGRISTNFTIQDIATVITMTSGTLTIGLSIYNNFIKKEKPKS